MEHFVQTLVDAVSVGGLYALTALGIGLIFGVMRLINFAHGELITIAGYTLLALFGLPVPVMLLGAIVVAVLLALVTERAAFRPLRSADPATLLISSFAVSFFLQKTLILVVGSRPKGHRLSSRRSAGRSSWSGSGCKLLQIVTIVVSAVLLVALTWFLRSTRFGLQMRAAAEDFRMARVLGVRANRVIAIAFALSGVLAAAVSCLVVVQTGIVQPRMGLQLVIIAFVGTVIGGLGSLTGAALGGFLVGAASILLQALLPPDLARLPRGLRVRRRDARSSVPAAGPHSGARPEGADLMPPVEPQARNSASCRGCGRSSPCWRSSRLLSCAPRSPRWFCSGGRRRG